MEIEEEVRIKQAFRIGNKSPHTMKVILENADDKYVVMSKVSSLKGKKNARRRLFFMNEDQTEADRELKMYYKDLQRENAQKDDENKLQIKLRKGRLLVNNTVIKPQISMPEVVDVLTLEDAELETIKAVKVQEATKHQEKGLEFICAFQKASDLNEVEAGLAKMKVKYV